MIENITGKPGGQLLIPDLVRIDSSNARGFELTEDDKNYYLKILLPDIDRYDVRHRSKTLTVDKKLLLPVAVRQHQVTLDKVQDLYYAITEIQINEPSLTYDFTKIRYPENYKPEEQYSNKALYAQVGKIIPSFQIITTENTTVDIHELKGKLILLDFWELWCGPCIASMPKIQNLYDKYRNKGLEVYGIMQEAENFPAARRLAANMKLGFSLGAGSKGFKELLSIKAVPVYMLLDSIGKIVYISEGFSEQLEEEILSKL